MTEKKEQILNAALELFAAEGFKSTSTSKVAKHAGVSEGLIFRHFTNKDGLLSAILELGEQQANQLFIDVIEENDPKKRIHKYIELAQKVQADEAASGFWKLQFKIKWETEMYGEHKLVQVENALSNAFRELNYEKPELEAQALMTLMDGMTTRCLLQKDFIVDDLVKYLLAKY